VSEHESPLLTALNLAFVIVCGCGCKPASPNPLPLCGPNPPAVVLRAKCSTCSFSCAKSLGMPSQSYVCAFFFCRLYRAMDTCVGVEKRVHLKDTFSRSQHVWFSWQLNFTTCSLRWVLESKSRNSNYVSQ